ncbi:acyltransferase domain-containing protein [Micromonospora sp. BRA006-A]|nr:acyltransferase domain-containing protein [Micromonospora sp. BRA006-A]
MALFRLIESFGVVPGHVAGHSIGEITAAHVAGVLSLADAATLVAARGRLMQAPPPAGCSPSPPTRRPSSSPWPGWVTGSASPPSTAPPPWCSPGPSTPSTGWSGSGERGVRTRRLRVSHAFHSPLMEPMLAEFRAVLDGLAFAAPLLPIVSNLTGRLAEPDEIRTPDYWVRHVREAVRYADGIARLRDAGVDTFLELGPQAVLTAMAAGLLPGDEDGTAVAALRAGADEPAALLAALAVVDGTGRDVDWAAVLAALAGPRPDPRLLPELPTYAFRPQRYWPTLDTLPVPAADPVDDAFWRAVTDGDLGRLGLDPDQPMRELLPELESWRRRQQLDGTLAGWRYRITWERRALTGADPGTWLVVAPPHQVTDRVLATLTAGAAAVHLLTVDPATATRDGLAADLDRLAAAHQPTALLSLLALDEAPHPEQTALPTGLAANLLLVQATPAAPARPYRCGWPPPAPSPSTGKRSRTRRRPPRGASASSPRWSTPARRRSRRPAGGPGRGGVRGPGRGAGQRRR